MPRPVEDRSDVGGAAQFQYRTRPASHFVPLPTSHPSRFPLRTANRKTKTLTKNAMSGIDVCRMMKRRLKAAGLPGHFSPHSFRVATVTDLLGQNVPLEDVQYLAGHADPRTTRIYDRRRWKVTRNVVERISI